MAEPALILVFFTVGAVSASDNPYLMNHTVAASPYVVVLPTHLLGLVAFFMIVLVENGRIPIDTPGGTTEISMIEESRVLEYSGREYALVKWGSWMKLFLMSAIFMNVFVLPWGLGTAASGLPGALLAIPVLLGKLALCGLAIVIIDTSFAKLRFFRIAEFLGAAFLLAARRRRHLLRDRSVSRMQSLSAASTAGVLLDLSGVLMLLLAFACLASKLFNRYVAYYGAQSVVLSFAAGTAAVAFHSAELWVLAGADAGDQGHRDPGCRSQSTADRSWRSSATPPCRPACPPR